MCMYCAILYQCYKWKSYVLQLVAYQFLVPRPKEKELYVSIVPLSSDNSAFMKMAQNTTTDVEK